MVTSHREGVVDTGKGLLSAHPVHLTESGDGRGRDHHATRHRARVSLGCCALSLYCIRDLSIVTYWLSVNRWPYFSLRWKKRSEYSLLDR